MFLIKIDFTVYLIYPNLKDSSCINFLNSFLVKMFRSFLLLSYIKPMKKNFNSFYTAIVLIFIHLGIFKFNWYNIKQIHYVQRVFTDFLRVEIKVA